LHSLQRIYEMFARIGMFHGTNQSTYARSGQKNDHVEFPGNQSGSELERLR
jgi:hypothetical protein